MDQVFVFDGAIYCEYCKPDVSLDEQERAGSYLVEAELEEFHGDACGGDCGRFIAPSRYDDLGWEEIDAARKVGEHRWAVCDECGNHEVYHKDSYDYRDSRKAALWRGLTCPDCREGKLRFRGKW